MNYRQWADMGSKRIAATLILGGFLTCRGRLPRPLFALFHGHSSPLRSVRRTRPFAELGSAIGRKWAAIADLLPMWVEEGGMWEWYATLLDKPGLSRRRDGEES